MDKFKQIIQEICIEMKIEYELLSKDWVFILRMGDVARYIVGYKFDLNRHGLGNVLDDKYAFYDVLTKCNLPVIEHQIIHRNYDKAVVAYYFDLYKKHVVLKSNTGTCGTGVFSITSLHELYEKLDELLTRHFSVSICPFYSIENEYRIIVLDNEVMLVYGKRKPVVIGDGKKTLMQLLQEFNPLYFANNESFKNEFYDIGYIPKFGEIVEYHWQFNLSRGATCFMVDDNQLKNKLVHLALTVSKKVGITFGSIDIIKTVDDKFFVMEANSGVMMRNFMEQYIDGEAIAKNIYKKAIEKMFEVDNEKICSTAK